MKKASIPALESEQEDLLPEYRFDYRKAKPNRLAGEGEKKKGVTVVLDEDVAEISPDGK